MTIAEPAYQSTRTLNRVVCSLALLLIIYASVFSWQFWDEDKTAQLHNLQHIAVLGEEAIDTYFTQLENSMHVLICDIIGMDDRIDINHAFSLVKKFKESRTELDNITFIRADGQILFTAKDPPSPTLPTLAQEPSFLKFLSEQQQCRSLCIGQPLVSFDSNEWIIPIQYSINDKEGKPIYVISASLPTGMLQNYWKHAPFTKKVALGLIRDDGFLVSRHPIPDKLEMHKIYGIPRTGALITYLRQQNFPVQAYVEGTTDLGGPNNLVSFHRLEHFPITLFIAMPISEIRADWWKNVKIPYILTAALLIGGFFIYRLTLRQERNREIERWNASQAQKDLNTFLDGVIENSPISMWISDDKGTLIRANQVLRDRLRVSNDEVIGKYNIFRDEQFEDQGMMPLIREVFEKGNTVRFTAEYDTSLIQDIALKYSTHATIDVTISAVLDSEGNVVNTIFQYLNISAQKQAEAELADSKAFNLAILNAVPVEIAVLDAEGIIISVNEAWRRFALENALEPGKPVSNTEVGDNYLMVCRRAANSGTAHSQVARKAEEGIKAVIDGRLTSFNMEYPCHSLLQKKWFSMQVTQIGSGAVVTHSDITAPMLAEDKLRKLSRAVQQNPVTIMITDLQGKIEFVNPVFTKLTGYTTEEAIGLNPKILTSGQTPPETYAELWSTITVGKMWEGEFHNKSKDGRLFWEHAVISPLLDENGTATHYLAVKEDITEKKSIMEQLSIAKEQADAANRAKSDFLANMSHEIRTPMNGIIGMTGLLLDTNLDHEQRHYADIVRSSGESLLCLINDILDFSKIEAKKLDLETLDFDLFNLLDDFVVTLAVRAHEKGLELLCAVDLDIPTRLQGDPGRLRQILINLVGNAIKFTQHGEIVVCVQLIENNEDDAILRFAVQDTGIGIPKEYLGLIFSDFTQADASIARQYGGTGLGLAISKQLSELMGGEVGVESEVGQGSEFWFTARLKKQPDGGQVETLPPPDFSNVRALIVDDNATNRQILVTQLTSWGMRPAEVPDGTAALEALLQAQEAGDPFRITIIDMHMPGMNGETLGLAVKADVYIADTHMVMLTSMGIKSDFCRLKEIGFDAYLNKPTRRHELKNALSQALSGRGLDQPQSIKTHHSAQDIIKLFAGSKARILLAEDNITNQQVAIGILNKLGLRTDAVANGAEAVTAVKTLPYDLVLMDVQMPVMDGLEATNRIRNYELEITNKAKTGDSPSPFVICNSSFQIPIIAMTAHAMQGDRERFLAAGMTDYISKPVSPQELVDRLEKWLPKIKDEGESIKNEREPGMTHEVKPIVRHIRRERS